MTNSSSSSSVIIIDSEKSFCQLHAKATRNMKMNSKMRHEENWKKFSYLAFAEVAVNFRRFSMVGRAQDVIVWMSPEEN